MHERVVLAGLSVQNGQNMKSRHPDSPKDGCDASINLCLGT